jgi:hypothetical protein
VEAERVRSPKEILQAAEAATQLSEQSLAAVAANKGLTVQQLRARLDGKLLELAGGGDVQAIAMLSERVAGVSLGRIERCRSAKSMHRRVMRALADGRISIAEASKLAGLVKLKRELELDDLSERVEQIEGTLVGRIG